MKALRFSFVSAAVLALGACSGDIGDGNCEGGGDCLYKIKREQSGVDTELSRIQAMAGQTVANACNALYDDGTKQRLAEADASLEVSPLEQVQVTGLSVRALKTGKYSVACKAGRFVDATPSELTIVAGPAARVTARVDSARVIAGATVNVTCEVTDEFGNQVASETPRVNTTPYRGVEVAGMQIHTEKAGDYDVTCTVGRNAIVSVPAKLTVNPGPASRIVTELSTYSVAAGERVEVLCHLADQYGNRVEQTDAEWSVTPTATGIDATGFAPERIGEYSVACSLPAENLAATPVNLHVGAGLPASMTITGVVPMKSVYGRGDTIEVQVRIADAWGNVVPAADWHVAGLQMASTVDIGFHRLTLIGNGPIDLEATVTSATYRNMRVSARTSILVDGIPPEIVFEFPPRAAILTGTPGNQITLRGRVIEATSGIRSLVINGQMVQVDGNGRFETPMTTKWGINLIDATAWDGADNRKDLSQSFEYASTYRRANPADVAAARITDGIIARINQAVLDDNNPDVDDLATIARLAIERVDLRSLIPSPVTTYNSDCSVLFVTITGSLRLYVDNVTFGTPIIDLTSINGGLRLRFEVPNVTVDMRTAGDVCDIGLGLRGRATANRIVVAGDLLVSSANGRVMVSMPNRNVQLDNLRIDLDLPAVIDWAVDGILSLFRGAIESRLESAFSDVIRDQIPPVIANFLETLDIGTGFNLPAPLNLRLNVGTRIGSMRFDSAGGSIGMDTAIYAQGRITPEPPGGILRESKTTPTFNNSRALGVGLSYDLMNQALYSLWYGGGLDLDLTQFVPATMPSNGTMLNLSARATGRLPPVIGPSGDPSFPLELQAGDLELTVHVEGLSSLPPIDVTGFAALFVKANARINNMGAVELMIGPQPTIALDLTTPLDGILDVAELTQVLEQAIAGIVPLIFNQVIGAIPIPSFDLSMMAGNYLPPGIVLKLGNAQTRFHNSYLLLEGDVVRGP